MSLKLPPTLDFATLSPSSCSGVWRSNSATSHARFGPYLGETGRQVVALVEALGREIRTAETYTHVLRRASFADAGAVRDILRYAFRFPQLLILCGRLTYLVGLLEFGEYDPKALEGEQCPSFYGR